jgi:hypothetical protein
VRERHSTYTTGFLQVPTPCAAETRAVERARRATARNFMVKSYDVSVFGINKKNKQLQEWGENAE